MTASPAAKPEFETDEELGIGVEDDAAGAPDALADLMANPALASLIDAAVTARMAQLGASPAPAAGNDALAALAKTFGHMIETNAMQQPGYIKPLPAHEVDRRLAGKVEMLALLADCERRGDAPLWEIGEGGFFECTNAQEFIQGMEIRMYLPPAEDMIPKNDAARKVMAAMMQWLGGPTLSIGEQVEAAHKAAHAPLVSSAFTTPAQRGPVELVTMPGASTTPARPKRRSMGSIVKEPHEVGLGSGVPGPRAPVGPQFDAAEAA